MKPQLTQEEKLKNKKRSNLKLLHNSILSAWSLHQLTTWHDVYKKLGYDERYIASNFTPEHLRAALVFPELKSYLERIKNELEAQLEKEGSSTPAELATQPTVEQPSVPQHPVTELLASTNYHVEPISGEMTASNFDARGQTLGHECIDKEIVLDAANDYGLIPSPNETAFHYWFQKKAISEGLDKIVKKQLSGILILSGTGTGKTFIADGILRRLKDSNYAEGRTYSHIEYLIITKATIIEQQARVLEKFYGLKANVDVEVINIEQLRSNSGRMWLKEDVRIVNGEEESFWIWKNNIQPCVVVFDESQGAKNASSTQSKIMCAYSNLPKNAQIIHMSATPFTRVSEAKCFAISTHRPLEHLGFPKGTVLNENNWNSYANAIASPSKPEEYNQAAIERLMNDLDEYIVRVRGVKPQFHAMNEVSVIDFETEEKRVFYEQAWERFLREKAKLDQEVAAGVADGGYMFTILLKQAMAAEMCHAEGIAGRMLHDVTSGLAACAALKFKGTIIEIVKILIANGVPRNKISLVWGGGQTQLTKKQKAKKKIKEIDAKLAAAGIDVLQLLEDCDLDEVEDRELQDLPDSMKLGKQSKEDRQEEIDRFQKGESLYCLYTFRAGGVGLSLHHTDEMTTKWDETVRGYKEWKEGIDKWNSKRPEHEQVKPGKVRRKESGFAFEEDIPFIPVRPRSNHIALTYNAIELVQGVGRAPRLTSLSTTRQRVYCYKGTVEQDIGNIVSQKLRCLTSVVKMKESWQDVIMKNRMERANAIKEALATTEGRPEEDNTMIDEGEEDEE